MTLFYCRCCSRHYVAQACGMCGGSACYWCLEWTFECRRYNDNWCQHMHHSAGECSHELGEVAHQVEVR
jgi:hypothetical protein